MHWPSSLNHDDDAWEGVERSPIAPAEDIRKVIRWMDDHQVRVMGRPDFLKEKVGRRVVDLRSLSTAEVKAFWEAVKAL